MNKRYIIDSIEKLINDEISEIDWDEACFGSSSTEQALRNLVIRLLAAYDKQKSGCVGRSDFLTALRSFSLAFQTKLRIDNASEFGEMSRFGLFYDSLSQRYYAVYDVPEFLPQKLFVENAFIDVDSDVPETSSEYCLKTNSFIEKITGYKYFKSLEQKLCVYGAINTPKGYTTLVSMPTGGGKSLITQALGYEKKGLSIVIVPTVSLAIDQERAARASINGAKDNEIFCYYSGANNIVQIKKAFTDRTIRLLFISPEALIKNEQFSQLIAMANSERYLQNVIVDEAHIVVAWGDFFRVDYQCLSPWRTKLLKTNPDLRTFLLSATYRDETASSLKQLFGADGAWIEIRCDSLRKEPHFAYVNAKNYSDKKKKVCELVDKLPHPMILYVNAPYEAAKWKTFLEGKGYGNVKTFTGETKSDDRKKLIDDWVNNKYDLMIATSAFGVGVDKPDVRSVIHLYMPESPDTYYQELGRGGRDGLPCLSIMCIEDEDIQSAYDHVGKVLTTDKLWGRWWSMYRNPNNQWQGGLIAIVASTKPNYNKINFFEEGNDTDEKWNINVLLLLNRRSQIQIVDLDLDNQNRYIFTIKILNDLITQDTAETKALFEKLRDDEFTKAQTAFKTIRTSIERADRLCWSEMFYETYPLVSECCPGCNCHSNSVITEKNRFPLVVDVKGPEKGLTDEMKAFFSNTNEVVLITDEPVSNLIKVYKPNVVVSNSFDEYIEADLPDTIYMNYKELSSLQAHDDGFYISGLVMAIYDNDSVKARKEYKAVFDYLSKKRYVIHVTHSDFCVSLSTGKYLTEQADGAVIR